MRRPSRLELTNTLSRTKEPLRTRKAGAVRIFTCGPSIYRRPHLGNYRSFIYEDLLEKYLEYLGYDVRRCLNFTDVEDKAVAEARETGATLPGLTEPVEGRFRKESAMLGIRLPDVIPRSTTSVSTAVRIIQDLMAKGHAYRHGDDVYFDPATVENFGEVYGLDMATWPERRLRFGRDTYPGHRWNLGDFILWKAWRPEDGEIYWNTELGPGRPSWNVQDPSMIVDELGCEVDIACGGVDNLYRHHDYNKAIMECYCQKEFTSMWLHGEHLLVDGRKMSKSLGNILYPGRLLDDGHSPVGIRHFLMTEHYRRPQDFTTQAFRMTSAALAELQQECTTLCRGVEKAPEPGEAGRPLLDVFEEAMNNDLQSAMALEGLGAEVKAMNRAGLDDAQRAGARRALSRIDAVLGVLQVDSCRVRQFH